jgi:hypothetical protein
MSPLKYALLASALLLAPAAARTQGDAGSAFVLVPGGTAIVAVDGSVHLSIVAPDADGGLPEAALDTVTSVAWTVNGQPVDQLDPAAGRLRLTMKLNEATYTAPHEIPKTNPVAVAVRFKPSPTAKTEVTLICNITVRDQGNFLALDGAKFPPSRFELNDKYSSPQMRAMFARATAAGPETLISLGPLSPAAMSAELPASIAVRVTLLVAGKTAGDYGWTLPGATANSLVVLMGPEQFLSADCTPHGAPNCNAKPTQGVTRVLSVDTATNTIRGTFQGQLVHIVTGKPADYVTVTGGFNAAIQGFGESASKKQ